MFANGMYNGQGVFTWASGATLTGTFVDDQPSYGTQTFSDGRVYTGAYRDNKRNGTGHMSWADGASYQGEWLDGQRSGQGTYTWPNGAVLTARFENDKPVSGTYAKAGEVPRPVRYDENGTMIYTD